MADDGSITLPERLERIEHMLESIDAKLDGKADTAHLQSVSDRVAVIERQGSASSQAAQKTAAEVKRDVERIKLKLAYYAGGLAVASFVLQYVLTKGWLS